MNISKALQNIKFDLNAILFDWGNTIMKVYPEKQGPMFFWDKVAPVDGANNVLPVLSEKYKLVLLSNAHESDKDLVCQALDRINLGQYFSNVFTPKELGCRKPSPNFYLKTLEHLQLEPENVLMIGDDYLLDIIAAKQVGLWTIWFNHENINHNSEFPYHNYEIQTLKEIPDIIKSAFKLKPQKPN